MLCFSFSVCLYILFLQGEREKMVKKCQKLTPKLGQYLVQLHCATYLDQDIDPTLDQIHPQKLGTLFVNTTALTENLFFAFQVLVYFAMSVSFDLFFC